MTDYKRHTIKGTKQIPHIPYGHILTPQEKALLQQVSEKRAAREREFREVEARRRINQQRLRANQLNAKTNDDDPA